MAFSRSCGVLMHPSSLPGRFGIGDLGPEAYRFVDFLVEAGQSLWQVLPLGPTGFGDSPYQCFSAFAGNPLLISPEQLAQDGLTRWEELACWPGFPEDRVDFGAVIGAKRTLLAAVTSRFLQDAPAALRAGFHDFCEAQLGWLDDYALFMALKDAHSGAPWLRWESTLARRDAQAIAQWTDSHAESILAHKIVQYLFFRQWIALKQYANDRGVSIIGDVPIFVAHDSSDVWAHRDLFYLDEGGRPSVVAGVPPDYFSATGQLWGNPLYRWDRIADQGYAWWIERLRSGLTLVDIIRLDHFRGFESFWEVPATESTAINGRWVEGPGAALFQAIQQGLGTLPIIAEDLGVITPEVEALRDQFGFPGMRVLQFAFTSDASSVHLPHNFVSNGVVYTGTHDNDTAAGWFIHSSQPHERDFARRYMAVDGHDIAWDMIRLALQSVARFALYPAQDLLGLGTEARMNFPSRAGGNWAWRCRSTSLTAEIGTRLRQMAMDYGRCQERQEARVKEQGALLAPERPESP